MVGPVAVAADGAAGAELALGEGVWRVQVQVDPTNRYWRLFASEAGLVTVHRAAIGKVAGAGWVRDGAGRGTFGFSVTSKVGLPPQGTSVYSWRSGRQVFQARVSTWAGGSLKMVTGRRHATFVGKARLTVTKGGASATTKGYRMQVEVIDAGPGRDAPTSTRRPCTGTASWSTVDGRTGPARPRVDPGDQVAPPFVRLALHRAGGMLAGVPSPGRLDVRRRRW